jgi:hypothetical protein
MDTQDSTDLVTGQSTDSFGIDGGGAVSKTAL